MKHLLTALVLITLAFAAVGCNAQLTAADIRADLADDLITPGQTKGEYRNQIAHTNIINLRKFNEDLKRLLLLERPFRGPYYVSTME